MKRTWFKTLLLPVACVLALAGGCVYDDLSSEMVVTEKVCVNVDEYRTNGTLGSAVVTQEFAEDVYQILEKYDSNIKDVKSISVVSGTYQVTRPSEAKHDWVVTSQVTIKRQDDMSGPVTDGPAVFVDLTSQSLKAAQGKAVPADLNSAGVALVDRALDDLLTGQTPRLILTMEGGTITPAPSLVDPLSFTWRACVTFQVVIDKNKKNGK